MKIALAQINSTLCDFNGNAEKIIDFCKKAAGDQCDLVVFPEAVLFGYHPFDLLERKELVLQQLKALKYIEKNIPPKIAALVGLFTLNKSHLGRPYFNSAALIQKKRKTQFFHKELLPTFDVFDEARFIEPGKQSENHFVLNKKRVQLLICEDMWAWPDNKGRSLYSYNPTANIKGSKVDLVVNMSASPFYLNKHKKRVSLAAKTAKHFKSPLVYVNMVGAQDEIIYDGHSFAVSKEGGVVAQALKFNEDLCVIDFSENPKQVPSLKHSEAEVLRSALSLGIRDFCNKIGLEKVHLGISGGIDSAVVASLAVDALGPSRVVGIALPTQFNSPESMVLAKQLCKNLDIKLIEVDIESCFKGLSDLVNNAFGVDQFSVVHENLQARIRGLILMAYSNHSNSLLLATSNKSEFAVGYATLYGDMCGGLAPIGDLKKEQVYSIAKLYNEQREVIPQRIIEREPSAELRPGQKDSESLPSYNLLDGSVERIVSEGLATKGRTDIWLLSALYKSEFKRWQAPPILKTSFRSFGRGRRWPLAHKANKKISK